MKDVYIKLKKHLDNCSTGFPDSASGIEFEILQKLFSVEDAELFLKLSPLPEKSSDIIKRINSDPGNTEKQLKEMAKKGLLFEIHNGNETRYLTPPFTMGIMEFQVNKIDKIFAEKTEKYFESVFGKTLQSNSTILKRTIQVNSALDIPHPIVPYNDALQIIDKQDKIALSECVCRVMGRINGTDCTKPLESCLNFGNVADYRVEYNAGRYVDKEEAKSILKESDNTGLVVMVSNSQMPGSMCACCSCCCIMLRSLKMQPNPAVSSGSNYFAEIDVVKCTGCGTCLKRCQMDAVKIEKEKAVLDNERCIGCGLCVSTCSSESLKLITKQNNQIYIPPVNDYEMYVEILKERGKL